MGDKIKEHKSQLILDFLFGQSESPEISFEKLSQRLKAILRKWGTPEKGSDEIIQETFLSLLAFVDKGKQIENPKYLMINILEKRRADWLRKDKSNPDINRRYLLLSQINSKIEKIQKAIASSGSEQRTSIDRQDLFFSLRTQLEQRDRIIDEIRDLSERTQKAANLIRMSNWNIEDQFDMVVHVEQRSIVSKVNKAMQEILLINFSEEQSHLILDRLYENLTFVELGVKYDCTKERAYNLYRKFIKLLKNKLSPQKDML